VQISTTIQDCCETLLSVPQIVYESLISGYVPCDHFASFLLRNIRGFGVSDNHSTRTFVRGHTGLDVRIVETHLHRSTAVTP
jgi:hypothetical protein